MPIRRLFVFSAAVLAFAQNTSGIDPRPSVADYPARQANDAVSVGAQFLSPENQHKALGKDWSGSHLIVEVALYPEPAHPLTVAPRDFMLRVGSETIAPVDAEDLAPYRNSNPIPPDAASKVHVGTVDTVGVASGPNGHKTVYTDSQVYVATGNTPYPAPSPVPQTSDPQLDRRRALEDKELPDIKTSRPVAGYLYFPKPKKAGKNATYELDYYGPQGDLKLPLEKKH
jgi:hypothetical protein